MASGPFVLIHTRGTPNMHNLSAVAWIITALGIALIVAAVVADLGETRLLGGILLALAGAVKIAIVAIWQRIAQLP